MRELIIFILIFLVVFVSALFAFNGRFIYAQLKYSFIGAMPVEMGLDNIFLPFSETEEYAPPRLVIPLIGVDAPVVLTQSINESIIQKDLENGVVRYPDSNIILGHSSAYPWYRGNYGSVFSLLNKLEKGDELFIFSRNEKYAYQVLEKNIELPKNLEFEDVENTSTLYLVSCWPINTTWKRIVIRAERVDPSPNLLE